jgi:hypothetical protein
VGNPSGNGTFANAGPAARIHFQMARVERATEPKTWESWAATRQEAVEMFRRFGELLEAEGDRPPSFRIDAPGYERAFESPDELLESVDEADWQQIAWLYAYVSVRQGDDFLFANLRIFRAAEEVKLVLGGGTRRSRNALMPDLEAEVAKYRREKPQRAPYFAVVVIGLAILAAAAQLIVVQVAAALGASREVQLAASIGAAILMVLLSARLLRPIGRAIYAWTPSVEYLPDNRVSRHQRLRSAAFRSAKVIGAVTAWLATVVAAIAAVILL